MSKEISISQLESVQDITLRHSPGFVGNVDIPVANLPIPADDSIYKRLEQSGVTGSVIADIVAGNEQFVIIDNPEVPASHESSLSQTVRLTPFNARASVSSSSPRSFDSPYVLVHIAPDGRVKGVAIPKDAVPIVVGRDDDRINDNKFSVADYKDAPLLSRHHFSVQINNQNAVRIIDLESRDGTSVRYSNEITTVPEVAASSATEVRTSSRLYRIGHGILPKLVHESESFVTTMPNYAHARDMQADEVWATPNNGGRPVDKRLERYIGLYMQIREEVVEGIKNGDIYKDTDTFIGFLQQLHRTPGLAENYNSLVSEDKRIELSKVGEFKTHTGTAPRTKEPTAVAKIAAQYGDAYAKQGAAGTELKRVVSMPGVPEKYCAQETIEYKADGTRRSIYTYPKVQGLRAYMEQATELGKVIEKSIKSGDANHDEVLALIAHQYQYLTASRPFRRINNSLFMQLANAQVKMLGYNGMTHGLLDHAAYRMSYENFGRYFVDRAKGLVA